MKKENFNLGHEIKNVQLKIEEGLGISIGRPVSEPFFKLLSKNQTAGGIILYWRGRWGSLQVALSEEPSLNRWSLISKRVSLRKDGHPLGRGSLLFGILKEIRETPTLHEKALFMVEQLGDDGKMRIAREYINKHQDNPEVLEAVIKRIEDGKAKEKIHE